MNIISDSVITGKCFTENPTKLLEKPKQNLRVSGDFKALWGNEIE